MTELPDWVNKLVLLRQGKKVPDQVDKLLGEVKLLDKLLVVARVRGKCQTRGCKRSKKVDIVACLEPF